MSVVAAPFRLNGFHVLGGIVAFFLVVIGTDIAFAVLAYRSFSGQVADNPYEAGLLYNRTLEQRRAEAALGWTAQADAAGGFLTLSFKDRDGAPLDNLAVTASLARPATETGRIELVLQPAGGGAYKARIATASGAWDIRGVARGPGGETFEVQRRVVLP